MTDRRLLPLFALAAVLATVLAWPPLSQLLSPVQGSYNEGWNAYRQNAAMAGIPLYASPPRYYVTNYTPLSFHLVGLLGRTGIDLVLAGRLVSLAALLVVCATCGAVAYQVCRVAWAAAFAALLFWACLAAFDPLQFGVDDPQLLGMALLMLGTLAYLHRAVVAPALLFSLALMVKQSFLPLPLCLGLHLLLTRRFGAFLAYAAIGAVCCAAMAGLFRAIDGPAILANLFFDRVSHWSWAVEKTLPFLAMFQLLFIAAAGVTVWQLRRNRAVQALALSGLGTLAVGFAAVAGDGVNQNLYFDALFILCALGAGGAGLLAARWGGIGIGLASLLLLPPLLATPTALLEARTARHEADAVAQGHAAALALLRRQPGPALCEHIKLCFDAAKPMVYDAFFVSDQLQLGKLDEAAILQTLDHRCWGAIQLELWRTDSAITATARPRFSAAFMARLLANYRQAYASQGIANGVAVFLPDPAGQAGPAGPCPVLPALPAPANPDRI